MSEDKALREVKIDGYPFKNYWLKGGKILKNGAIREPNYRPIKLFLIKQYGVCYHCGKPVKDYPQQDGINIPHDAATIDHLAPRQQRRRYEKVEKVLACFGCNQKRNDLMQKGRKL